MRLDHLLSKEHCLQGLVVLVVPEPGLSPSVGQRVLMGGTSIMWRRPGHRVSSTGCSPPSGGVGSGTGSVGRVRCRDTLLGPEGSGDMGLWPRRRWSSGVWVCAGWFLLVVGPADSSGCPGLGVGCRLYVENFTVDASIFVVFKFLRAHGGCLGTRNRRRT